MSKSPARFGFGEVWESYIRTSTEKRGKKRQESVSRKPRVPLPNTLRKYGLTAEEWLDIARRQGWVCAVCKKLPPNGRLCTDHDHVKGWKKMKPDQRKKFVRGLLCFWCNSAYVGRAITILKAKNVYRYLKAHRNRIFEGD